METKLHTILCLVLFFASLVSITTVKSQGQSEWVTTYIVEVQTDGSANWIIERRTLNASDVFQYSSIEYLQEFSSNINALVDKALIKTGREDMKAENFTTTTTFYKATTGSYGTIKYKFDWSKFAESEDTRIIVREVFVDGIFLFGNGTLIVRYPQEYLVIWISPKPDVEFNQTTTWYKLQNFKEGEPILVVQKEKLNTLSSLEQYFPIIAGIATFGICSLGLWFFKFRKRERTEVGGSVPKFPLVTEDAEEKIIMLLKTAGGRSDQSAITQQLGFSRSKTSKLLTAMEDKKIIVRQKKGREKLVTLVNEMKK